MRSRRGSYRYPLFLGLAVAAGVSGVAAVSRDDGRLARGIHVEGVDVSGLTPAEAELKVSTALRDKLPDQLVFTSGKQRFGLSNAAINRRLDVAAAVQQARDLTSDGAWTQRAWRRLQLAQKPLSLAVPVRVDSAGLAQTLRVLGPKVASAPKNASVSGLAVDGDRVSRLEVEEAAAGQMLDVAKTLQAAMGDGLLPAPREVPLAVKTEQPTVSAGDLHGALTTVLARYSTNMSRHYGPPLRENRRHNVELCLPRFRGTVLAPGEEFSFNGVIGERKVSEGFKDSIVFKRQPDGSIKEEMESGGGICQLATTMFDAVVLANLKVTERQNHSKVVGYAPIARDAAVYWGAVDLKFRNTLSHPVMVWGEMDGWDLVISVIGHADDKAKVTLISDSWSAPAGQGGKLWRRVETPGGEVLKAREWVADSFYPREKANSSEEAPVTASKPAPAPKPKASPPKASEGEQQPTAEREPARQPAEQPRRPKAEPEPVPPPRTAAEPEPSVPEAPTPPEPSEPEPPEAAAE